jgi:phosphohistidine phosphatase
MDLFVIRHADALPIGEHGVTDDFERPLSDEGRDQARRLAGALQHLGVTLNQVLTSPLVRARQTAEEILREWQKPSPTITQCDELMPGGRRKRLSRFLRERGGDMVAIVGHQPDLGQYAAWLVGAKKAQIDLAKAGVAYIVCGEGPRKGGGLLRWLLTPACFPAAEKAQERRASER